MAKKAFKLADNPLVNPPALPNGAPPLDLVKPEHFEPAIDWAIEKARARIENIKNVNPPSFSSTFEELVFFNEELVRICKIFSNQVSTMGTDELRDLQANVIGPKLSRFQSSVTYDQDLFAQLKTVYDRRLELSLNEEQTRLLHLQYDSFASSGALLADDKKQRLTAISERLGTLSAQYSTNVIKSSASYEKLIDKEEDLAGLSADAKAFYKQVAKEKGHDDKWMIPLSPPPIDVLSSADNRALREEIWRAMGQVATSAPHDNRPLIIEILNLRQEQAEILGFDNYADCILSGRMAGDTKTVNAFLDKNLKTYKAAALEEMKQLEVFAWKRDSLKALEPWDTAYYHNKLKEQTFQLKADDVRAYFELDNVVKGLFGHAEKLFGIKISEKDGKYPVHHPDVKTYELHDGKTGDLLGVFYADYFARDGAKRGGAWMTDFRSRGQYDGKNEVPLVINVCNIPKPPDGEKALLSMDQVRTIFHKFGHGLHGLLAQGEYSCLTGTSVLWDWVELPSQLMENWVTQKEVLDNFAVHYKTGAKMPPDMMQKINDMENFGAGSMGLRQTGLAMLDMACHTADPKKITAVEDFEKAALAPTSILKSSHKSTMAPRFPHIFAGGYAAGYYSYKWAQVLDADVFSRFEEKGLYDRETADNVRRHIYARGGIEPPMVLFKRVMGRDPDPQALFRREGLDKKPAAPQKGWPSGGAKPKSKLGPDGP